MLDRVADNRVLAAARAVYAARNVPSNLTKAVDLLGVALGEED